ncbi:MAG: chromosome segregation protein SMC, partial [Proteobacteria bacterium]|nr:chromosome segregation protein SMC [Pseudomonadota bacterium]
ESDVESARKSREETRQERQEAENRKAKLDAEIETLESIVRTYSGEGFRPVLDDIHTDEGFELALSRALGDTLMASSDSAAPVIWQLRRSMDVPSLPVGAESLTPRVRAPEVLKLALSQIGIVGGEEEGDRLAAHLKPGQTLVSREGGLWRWDGLTVRMAASDRHAVQLQQKNRLDELLRKTPDIESSLAALREKQGAAEKTLADAQAKLSEKQKSLQASDADLRTKRIDLTKMVEAQAARQAELAKLEEALTLVDADLTAIEEKLENNALTLKEFDDARFAAQQEKIDAAREGLAAARERLHEAIKDFEISRQENSRRKARLHAITDERVNLQNRCIRARERIRELDGREEQLKEKIVELQGRPGAIREESERLLSRIGEIEQEKAAVSDRLTALEGELADTTKALKEAESLLSEAREARAHAQATTSERQNHMNEIRSFIRENFNNMTPEDLSAEAAISDEAMPDLDDLKQKKEKSARDRDLIGAVNLRADQEVEDLEKQLGGIISEKNDLASAIEELRQGIEKLNGEARERLNTAFTRVNDHFRELFTRLFNGGKAHLALIEADDPLEAGLEIFAQPPGKALQSLSLLSGGEQSLTAIALIFAIFLTNPAPICVLDEVDAPLDDANVDRFCDLLEEFADKGETRFLVITHHRMTMARMDRLYGVTMSERGVSQLVSVDLNQQLDFLEAAA